VSGAIREATRAGELRGDCLFGGEFSVADAYLYVMLRWAGMQELDLPEPLPAFFDRREARPAVRLALQHEGLA
jgi:glutathione S-transferase